MHAAINRSGNHVEGAAELHVCRAGPCRQHETTNVCARTARHIDVHTSYVHRNPADQMIPHVYRYCRIPSSLRAARCTPVDTRGSEYVYAHTHRLSTAASSAHAIAHTCTWRRCSHMHAHTYISQRQLLVCICTYRTSLLLFIDGDIHARTLMRAQMQTLRRTRVRAKALHVPTVIRTEDRFSMSTCM